MEKKSIIIRGGAEELIEAEKVVMGSFKGVSVHYYSDVNKHQALRLLDKWIELYDKSIDVEPSFEVGAFMTVQRDKLIIEKAKIMAGV